MYAHQVIDDLNRYKKNQCSELVESFISFLITKIQKAQHFSLGEYYGITSYMRNQNGALPYREVFNIDMPLNTPYEECWLDYDFAIPSDKIGPYNSTKRGILITGQQKTNIIQIFYFGFQRITQKWTINLCYWLASLNSTLDKNFEYLKNLPGMEDRPVETLPKGHTIQFIFPVDRTWPSYDQMPFMIYPQNQGSDCLAVVEIFLKLLSCKNIATTKNPAPEALNKARRKKGKTELYTYHTLKLVPFGNKQKSAQYGEPESHYRIHLCRGHFKRYTEDKPLFGKYTGLYWWQPMVRGKDKSGVVMKDYALQLSN